MTLTDGSILRRIGLQLQRDEHGTARPIAVAEQQLRPTSSKDVAARASLPSIFFASTGNPDQHPSSVQSAGPLELIQGGCLPTEVKTPLTACAWCDAEAGIKPHPGMSQSHGICERHLAAIKAQLAELRQAAA